MRVILCSVASLSVLLGSGVMPVFAQGMGGMGGMPGIPGIGQPQQPDPPAEKEKAHFSPDDPAVQAATPPPADAKLLTKVGWCEVQVYGHTFSDAGLTEASMPATHMHLSARLLQLNEKLNFKPGEKGIKLMDDIDAMVTFARDNAKKPAAQEAKPATTK